MFLNISKPIKQTVTIIDRDGNKKTINTRLSKSDIKRYFDAEKVIYNDLN